MPTPRIAEDKAIELIKGFNLKNPPIDVEYIVEKLGIKLKPQDLEDDVSAILVVKGNNVTIGVNQNHAITRQRFSIAHELGHYMLHRSSKQIFVDKSLTYYRDQSSSEGEHLLEIQANAFAAELLMPEIMLKEYVLKHKHDLYDDESIDHLASIFNVSRQALTIRITNLLLKTDY